MADSHEQKYATKFCLDCWKLPQRVINFQKKPIEMILWVKVEILSGTKSSKRAEQRSKTTFKLECHLLMLLIKIGYHSAKQSPKMSIWRLGEACETQSASKDQRGWQGRIVSSTRTMRQHTHTHILRRDRISSKNIYSSVPTLFLFTQSGTKWPFLSLKWKDVSG